MAVVKELFNAYFESDLPLEGGYIICSFFDPHSIYSRYETTSYSNAKDIYDNEEGLIFLADGWKIFMLVEPMNYPGRDVEPAERDDLHRIPYRFADVETFVSKRRDRVMVGKTPLVSRGSFAVTRPRWNDFAYILHETEDVRNAIREFIFRSLWQEANVPRNDAEKVASNWSFST